MSKKYFEIILYNNSIFKKIQQISKKRLHLKNYCAILNVN